MYKVISALLVFSLLATGQGNPTPKKLGYGPGEQDWGWIDVRTGSHMFFWLYYTTAKVNSYYERPLVIWLQGGPGGSSTGYGNFAELGPLHINGSLREYAWNKYVNVLFIDNPVGTGYSYVDNPSYLTKNNVQIGADMVAFLAEFYRKFPDFKKSPLYIFCESYGGKMTAEIAKQLYDAIRAGKLNISFKGVALGDSWISPIDSVMTWGPLLLNTGLIDQRSYGRIMNSALLVDRAISDGKYELATSLWGSLEVEIMKETSNVDFYNILYKVKPLYKMGEGLTDSELLYKPGIGKNDMDDIEKLMNGPVRKALGIPTNITYGKQSMDVFNALRGDFMKPVTKVVEHLLDNTNLDVVVFSGQLDLIVDTYGTLRWVDRLKWKGSSGWKAAKREPLVLNNFIEGYVMKNLNLYFYWINRAGHMVPTDNPETSVEMLRRVTKFDAKVIS